MQDRRPIPPAYCRSGNKPLSWQTGAAQERARPPALVASHSSFCTSSLARDTKYSNRSSTEPWRGPGSADALRGSLPGRVHRCARVYSLSHLLVALTAASHKSMDEKVSNCLLRLQPSFVLVVFFLSFSFGLFFVWVVVFV